MAQPTADIKVNPSKEIIRLGPRAVRFLITGENSGGSIAILSWLSHVRSLAAPPTATTNTKRRSTATELLTWTVDRNKSGCPRFKRRRTGVRYSAGGVSGFPGAQEWQRFGSESEYFPEGSPAASLGNLAQQFHSGRLGIHRSVDLAAAVPGA